MSFLQINVSCQFCAKCNTLFYHTSNSRKRMGVNGEALQLHAVYKKPYFLLQVMRESVSVLQVTCVRLNVQCNRRYV